MPATYPVLSIHPDFITLLSYLVDSINYEGTHQTVFRLRDVSPTLTAYTHLSTVLPYSLNLCPSFHVRGQVSHPNKTNAGRRTLRTGVFTETKISFRL